MHLDIIINKKTALSRFSKLITYKTIESENNELVRFQEALISLYPNINKTCRREIIDKGIIYHWKGTNSDKSMVLMSHYDVVPAENDGWTYPPFSGKIAGGRIWGRGTIDTKCTLAAIMESVESLINEGFTPHYDIYLCFGGDEESTGNSAVKIAALLKARGIFPYLILDEGGAVVHGKSYGINLRCALIGIAEKGYMDIEFTSKGKGGHTSLATAFNPLTEIAEAIKRINNNPFKFEISSPLKIMINTASKYANLKYRTLMKTYPFWGRVFRKKVSEIIPEVTALSGTIGAITQINGGNAANVIPEQVTAVGNFRIISGSSVESTLDAITKALKGLQVDVKVLNELEPSKVSNINSMGWKYLCSAINETFGDSAIIPYLMLARSDSRSYSEISDGIFRFSPIKMSKRERGSIHGIDESIEIENFIKAIRFYINLLLRK